VISRVKNPPLEQVIEKKTKQSRFFTCSDMQDLISIIIVPSITIVLAIISIVLFFSRRRIRRLYLQSERSLKIVQEALDESAKIRFELKEALERVENISRNKTSFLATASHEIRTPLNVIVGYSEFLSDPQLPSEKVREYAHGISLASHSLLSLINDVLDIAKFDSGHHTGIDLRNGECDLKELFEEMRTVFGMQCMSKGLSIVFDIAPDFPNLMLSEARFRQILFNLIGNAIKFTEHGGVTVRAKYDSDSITLSVQDTGIGITDRGKKVIFDPFVQDMESRRGRIFAGTGLGLSIVRQLVEASNGTITVDSVLGKGSTFTIKLDEVKALPSHKREMSRLTDSVPTESGKAEIDSIVIVDDMAMNRQILQLHLQSLGKSKISSFASGKEVLEYLEAGNIPDIILTDMWMPEMDGSQLAQAVIAKWPQVSVVAVTADNVAGEKFDLSVFRKILVKPVTGPKLKQLLSELQSECSPVQK